MNIKNIVPHPILSIDPKQRVEGNPRAQASADRDPQNQRDQSDPENKRHLSQQEFDDALKILGENPGLKSNHLTIHVETQADCRVILILDPEGKVVRRLTEGQLWSATRDKHRQTGRILDKAM